MRVNEYHDHSDGRATQKSRKLSYAVAQFTDGGSFEGYYRWKGITRLDWTWHNFDINATWNYIGGFREKIKQAPALPNEAHEHWVHPTNFIDAQASYTLIFSPPVEAQPVAGYSKAAKEVMAGKDGKPESTAAYSMPCWKTILNNSSITLGCNDIFSQDPPKTFGLFAQSQVNYPGGTYDNMGRFWYVQLRKKF